MMGSAPGTSADLPAPGEPRDTIVVTGQRRVGAEAATTVLDAEALSSKLAATLGETLAQEPGVSNASFGPAVGLPVIRGLTGTRVRLMQDGIGAHDVSSMSPDHATTLEPALADTITIIRGPSTLRYGGNAIGGLVDVSDNRVPRQLPSVPFSAAMDGRYGDNGNMVAGSARADAGLGSFAINGAVFGRDRGDLEVPGWALDEVALTQRFGPDERANVRSYVDNTDSRAVGGSLGGSYVGASGFVGAAVSASSNDYGIPAGSHSHGAATSADVRSELRQTRGDLRSAVDLEQGLFRSVAVEAAYVDVELSEAEGSRPGTVFSSETIEARIDLGHEEFAGFVGTVGLQAVWRDFSALGAEAFVPRSRLSSTGIFIVEEIDLGAWEVEVGARAEVQEIRQLDSVSCQGLGITVQRSDASYLAQSYSAALARPEYWGQWRLGVARTQRAPDIQELLSCGAHLGTKSYDLSFSFDGTGVGLRQETFSSIDAGIDWVNGRLDGDVSVFYYDAADFIYQQNLSAAGNGPFFSPERGAFQGQCTTGDECFPVYQYTQADARFVGAEGRIGLRVMDGPGSSLRVGLVADTVRARFAAGGDVPRIPPLRVGAELGYESARFTVEGRLTHGAAQSNVGNNELPTDGYWLLNSALSYRMRETRPASTLFITGRNLLNDEIRSATSFLRDYSPEPGRSIEIGMRAEF